LLRKRLRRVVVLFFRPVGAARMSVRI
jgi:hypothetical protein